MPSSSIRNIFIRKARWFRVKTPATMPDDLSLVPRTHVGEKREPTPEGCALTSSTCVTLQTHTHRHGHMHTPPKCGKSWSKPVPCLRLLLDTLAWLSLSSKLVPGLAGRLFSLLPSQVLLSGLTLQVGHPVTLACFSQVCFPVSLPRP